MIEALLVEDDEAHAELIHRVLQADEPTLQLRTARNLSEARDALAKALPDILIVDYQLPDGTGIEMLPGENLQGDYPIIMMTSYGNEQLAVQAMKSGALDYFVKSDGGLEALPLIVRRSLREWDHVLERRRFEKALKESEARLKRAQSIARIGDFVWDAAGRECIHRSEVLCEILDLPSDSAGRTFSETLEQIHPHDREAVRAAFQAAEKTCELEYRVIRPDGESRHIRQINELEFDGNGALVRRIGTIQDITALKRTEDILRQAQKMEAVGQLTGGLAHDFNNLLGIVQGNAELFGEDLKDSDPRVQAILEAAERGANLTQQLLAFSRIQPLQPLSISVETLVHGMLDLLTRTLGERVEVEAVGDTGLWFADIDANQLEHAVLNLALNARDAMPEGGKLTIETSNVRLDEDDAAARGEVTPGQYVMLAVVDNGTGMAPKVREQAFEPFFTTKEIGAGSGLGLSMVYGFVKQSGGHATIVSEEGKGTAVKLYLPRATEAPATGTDATEALAAVPQAAEPHGAEFPAREREGATNKEPQGRGETVLLVEDDPGVRELTIAQLDSLGYKVIEGATGAAALEQLDLAAEIDLLLTDVILRGDMNGREVAEEVQRRAPGIKVLYMSGFTRSSFPHNNRLDAGTLLLKKPFRIADLARAVRSVLDG